MPMEMSATEKEDLEQTSWLRERLRRSSKLGRANGTAYIVFGALSLLLALPPQPDWLGMLIGAFLLGAGFVERNAANLLRRCNRDAAARMAQSELALLGAIIIYSALKLTVLRSTVDEVRAQLGDASSLGLDLSGLMESLSTMFYSLLICGSLLYQGLMARYFMKRRVDVARYLETPEWARVIVESIDGRKSVS